MTYVSTIPSILRIFRQSLFLLVGLLFTSLTGETADAAQLKSIKVTETQKIQTIHPEWPVPRDRHQLFYLQRSMNANTIVFVAVFDASGNLRSNKPAQAYWRRYDTTGERKPLKPYERALAFGMNINPTTQRGVFNVSLKPLPQMPMQLRQTGPGKAEVYATVGGRKVRAVYAYVAVDESGWIPKVTHLTINGVDLATGRAISETFRVNGGSVRY